MANTMENGIGKDMLLQDLNTAIVSTDPTRELEGTCVHHKDLASGVWVLLRIERERFGSNAMRPRCKSAWEWMDRHPVCAAVILIAALFLGGTGAIFGLIE